MRKVQNFQNTTRKCKYHNESLMFCDTQLIQRLSLPLSILLSSSSASSSHTVKSLLSASLPLLSAQLIFYRLELLSDKAAQNTESPTRL